MTDTPKNPPPMPDDALPVHGTNIVLDDSTTIVEIDGVKFCQSHNGMMASLLPLRYSDQPPPIKRRQTKNWWKGKEHL